MEKLEIGRFYAVSFDEKIVLEFVVYDNNTIDCPTLGLQDYKEIDLKPRLHMLRYKEDENGDKYDYKGYTLDIKPTEKYKNPLGLIGKYNMDEDLFYYLKENHMINYSSDMAYLYDLPDKYGYDHNDRLGVRSPFKWAKKKGPILVKQRQGQLN